MISLTKQITWNDVNNKKKQKKKRVEKSHLKQNKAMTLHRAALALELAWEYNNDDDNDEFGQEEMR